VPLPCLYCLNRNLSLSLKATTHFLIYSATLQILQNTSHDSYEMPQVRKKEVEKHEKRTNRTYFFFFHFLECLWPFTPADIIIILIEGTQLNNYITYYAHIFCRCTCINAMCNCRRIRNETCLTCVPSGRPPNVLIKNLITK